MKGDVIIDLGLQCCEHRGTMCSSMQQGAGTMVDDIE